MYLRLALPDRSAISPLNEVSDPFFRRLLVRRLIGIADDLAEDGEQTMTHSGSSKRIFMVPSERWLGCVLFRRHSNIR